MPPATGAVAPFTPTLPALTAAGPHRDPTVHAAGHETAYAGSLGRGIGFGLLLAIPLWAAIVTAVMMVLA